MPKCLGNLIDPGYNCFIYNLKSSVKAFVLHVRLKKAVCEEIISAGIVHLFGTGLKLKSSLWVIKKSRRSLFYFLICNAF